MRLNVILHKTELAKTELSSSKRSLSLLERRILLFADGVRNIEQIRELVNNSDAGEQIYLLEKKGFLSKNKAIQIEDDKPIVSVVDEFLTQIKPLINPIAINSFVSKLISPVTIEKSNDAAPLKVEQVSAIPPSAKVEQVSAIPASAISRIAQQEPQQEITLDEATKSAIKLIIADSCDKYLGIFSRELMDKTQRAQDPIQLRTCISQWHMAMLESKTGREYCFDLLNEVNELFNHGIALELKIA